ncbi:hypothetical protein AB1284_26010 [Bacillus sp. S2(2024)]|uniref:hypothetical protein n=1 Tax=Bacillus sp. S2(2024) TaxID=3162887 RepID=UPI003D211AEC
MIRRIAIVGHLTPNASGTDYVNKDGYYVEYATGIIREMENGLDAIIPGEVVEWTVLSYIRDAVQLGKIKAMFNTGHFSLEELGMKYAAEWIAELVENKVATYYVSSGDIYQFE